MRVFFIMGPIQPGNTQSLLANSMAQGIPAIGQISPQSPNFQPQLAPQSPIPMPDKSPMSALHKALLRRGMQPPPQVSGTTQNAPAGQPQGQPKAPKPPKTEAEKIVEALTSRLEMLSQGQQAQPLQPAQQTAA